MATDRRKSYCAILPFCVTLAGCSGYQGHTALLWPLIDGLSMASENTIGDMSALNAWYKFSNNYLDSSGNGLDLSPSATAPTPTANRVSTGNTAYAFNFGQSTYLTHANSALLNFTNQGSISYWVNITAPVVVDDKHICKANGSLGYCIGNGLGNFKVEFYDASAGYHMFGANPSPVLIPLTAGAWTHIVVTASSGTSGRLRAYINGVLRGEIPWGSANAIGQAPNSLYVGAGWFGIASFMTGAIDDIRIYPRELNASEVLYLSNLPPD